MADLLLFFFNVQVFTTFGCMAGLIRGGILFLDATYATCSVGLRATL
jgi:hypothetical protein